MLQDEFQDEEDGFEEESKPSKSSPPQKSAGSSSTPTGRDQHKDTNQSRSKDTPRGSTSKGDTKGKDTDQRQQTRKDAKEFDEFNDEDDEEDDAFDLYGDFDDKYEKSGRGNRSPAADYLPDDSSYRKSSGQTSKGSASTPSKDKAYHRKDEQLRYLSCSHS